MLSSELTFAFVICVFLPASIGFNPILNPIRLLRNPPTTTPALCVQFYVHARMQGKWTRLVRPTIQFFLVAFALFVGYTRVSDNKHHWSDVLIGLLQGALIAVLTVSSTCTR